MFPNHGQCFRSESLCLRGAYAAHIQQRGFGLRFIVRKFFERDVGIDEEGGHAHFVSGRASPVAEIFEEFFVIGRFG